MRRTLLIAQNEARLLQVEPWPVLLLILMPAVLAAFFTNGAVGGPAQAITGMAGLFGFFGISAVAMAFYRDHAWMTWDRLRVSGIRPFEVVAGKLLPLAVVFAAQYVVLFSLGWTVFDMPWRGSILGGVLVAAALVTAQLALGMLLTVLCTSMNQVSALSSLAALLLAGIGGALAPVRELPGWVQDIAPVSPVYWALDGFGHVITESGSVGDVARPVTVLLSIAGVAFLLSAVLYDHEKRKAFFA